MVEAAGLPADALLGRYAGQGCYTDCFTTVLPRPVTHAEYVEAFFTTPVFKLERLVLVLIRRPSTDAQAGALSRGEGESFAAWDVEARAPDQVLLRDLYGSTRAWLMTAAESGATRLYFGSAVVKRNRAGQMPRNFSLLLGFHVRYSKVLLGAAARRLAR